MLFPNPLAVVSVSVQSRRQLCLPPLGLLSAMPKEQPLEKRPLTRLEGGVLFDRHMNLQL